MSPLLLLTAKSEPSLSPVQLMLDSSGVVLVVLLLLIAASTLVWLIWFAKWMQLARLRAALHHFEQSIAQAQGSAEVFEVARQLSTAPGAQVVLALSGRVYDPALTQELLTAVSHRALADEEKRINALMPTMSSIASASPFIGLFGTVWGIMDAFLRIGVEKSASLPVVAPAIGEALIATAFGLIAAIPATIGYNYLDRRIGDLLDELNASADVWVARLYSEQQQTRATRGQWDTGS